MKTIKDGRAVTRRRCSSMLSVLLFDPACYHPLAAGSDISDFSTVPFAKKTFDVKFLTPCTSSPCICIT
jgi:hypothetical protein